MDEQHTREKIHTVQVVNSSSRKLTVTNVDWG